MVNQGKLWSYDMALQYKYGYHIPQDYNHAVKLDKHNGTPLGRFVNLMYYVDVNLYNDLITRRSITGILHLANKTPIDWYSKKQATVETATYGSEFIACICVDQSVDLKNTVCYLGVTVHKKA